MKKGSDRQVPPEDREAEEVEVKEAGAGTAVLDEPVVEPDSGIPDEESKEILALQDAVEQVHRKMEWHKTQIVDLREDIRGHENQIDELRTSLKRRIGGLIGTDFAKSSKIRREPHKPIRREDGPTTGELIKECLRENRKPQNTEAIKAYLEQRGCATNPSVELSRLVSRGEVVRPNRGFYTLPRVSSN